MSRAMLIAGGGTGGHLFPGVAVAQALLSLDPDLRLAFVSAGRALESEALRRAGLPLERLKVKAVRGVGLWGRVKALALLPGALWAAHRIIWRYRPGLILAVGGYASFPLGLAAWLGGVPLAVQEQNAVPGMTNRLLSNLARVVFAAFEESRGEFPAGKTVFTGNPVREKLLAEAREAADMRPEEGGPFTVLILGGSQGARSLNQAVTDALPILAPRRTELRFIHQTGPADQEWVRAAYAEREFSAEVADFFPEVGRAYGAAHLVICRAGAGTLTEVCAVGRAAVAVPYPHAAGDHQTKNAQALVKAGAARLIADRGLDGAAAAAAITGLMDDPARRRRMEEMALGMARPDAAGEIARLCLQMLKEAA